MGISMSGGITPSGSIKLISNNPPIWITPVATIGSFDEGTAVNFQFEATDPEQGIEGLVYTLEVGPFPTGLSLSSSGLLTGTAPEETGDHIYDFLLRVTDSRGLFALRPFGITINNVVLPGSRLFGWGSNSSGAIGDDTNVSKSTPVQIGLLTEWADISNGTDHSLAVRSDGSLWAWGLNFDGQLGLGDTVGRSSPVQIGSSTDWSSVGTGHKHSFAIKISGALWAWGDNSSSFAGHLGLGDINDRSSPVQVGALTNWASIDGGFSHTLAIKTNNTLWSWGRNNGGQLGHGNTSSKDSPVQVGSLTDWSNVAAADTASHAIRTGRMFSWGLGVTGRLGLGNTTNYSSPVQVGALTNWNNVSSNPNMGQGHAVKTDGTMWGWGDNSQGQVGDGTKTQRNSPVQVGSLTDWSSVEDGHGHVAAIKTDGTLWAWGDSASGRTGLGNTTDVSSPVQVGSETIWTKASAGKHVTAIKTTI